MWTTGPNLRKIIFVGGDLFSGHEMNKIAAILTAGALVAGCGVIQEQSRISTPVGQRLTAGVGDVMLRSESRENMPNAFGGADMFGRTRPTGISTVQFGGMQGDKVVLLRGGVITQSNATTLNSTPLVVPTQQNTVVTGNVGVAPFSANATTTEMTYIPATGSTDMHSQQATVPIVIDWRANPRIPAAGRMIVIEAATPTALQYHVE